MADVPGRKRRWLRVTLGVTAAVAVIVSALAFAIQVIWDGSYELTVRIENRGPPIRCVSCESHGMRDDAEFAVAHRLPPESAMWSVVEDPFQGEPINVRVAVSGHDSFLGFELSRSQFRYLAVIVTYADGRKVGQVVDIPDMRESREVTVIFP